MKRCLVIAAGNRFDDINLQQLTSIVREYEIDLVTEISFGNETTQKIDFLIWIYSDDGFQERDDLVSFIEALSIAEHLIPIVGTCAFIPPSVAMLNPIRFDVGIRSLEQVYPLPALHNLIRRILASDTENPRIAASQALFTTATGVSDDLWTSLRSGENQRRGAVTQIVERMYPVVRSSQNWMLAEIRHLISHSGQSLLVLISDANLRSQSAVADAYQDLKRGVMPRIEISSPIADVVGDIAVFSLAEQLSPTALFERLTLTLSKDAYILQQLAEFDTRLSTRQKFYKLAAILIENTKLILITDIEPFVQRDGILDSSLADNLLRAVATNGTRHAIVVANSQGNVEVFQGYDGRIPLLVPSAIRPSVLQPVPNHTTVPYMLPDLERQAAEYYATSRKTIKAFELPTDIDPFLNEIEHLVKAEDYDRACEEFIAATERISLARWGSYSQLRKVILRFLGHPLKDAFRGRMLGILGNYYEIAGMYKDGVEHLTEALKLADDLPDLVEFRPTFLTDLASCHIGLSNYLEAIRFDEQALRENADKDLHSKAIALNGLGIAYRNIGNYDKAIEYYEQALVLARQEKDTASEGRVLGNLGNCYFYVGDYARAIDYNRQGLDLALRLRQKRAEGIRLGNLALAYSAIGNYKEALLHAERALQICVEVDDKRNESINRGYVAICHHNLGSYDEAIRNHNLSLAIAREYGMRSIEAYRVDAIGETYMTIGEYDRAEQQYAEALRITTEINTLPQQNFIRMKLGQLHLMQDRFTDGVSLLEAVVANPTPLVEDRARMLLGVGYLKLGRREAAILQFKAAREAAERILAKSELAYRASYSEALAFYGMLIASDASDAPPPDTILGIGASFSKAVRGCRDVGALTELTIPYSMLKLLDEQAIFRTLDIIIEGTENGSSNPAT